MSHGISDEQRIATTNNVARFFVENRQISWVLLIAVCIWGTYAYFSMPQRKDPDIPVREAAAIAYWEGADTQQVEQLVTKKMEDAIAGNENVTEITSTTRGGVAVVNFELNEKIYDTSDDLNDIGSRLDAIKDFPKGVSPVIYIKDFGDTAALMLTVASPKAGEAEIAPRAEQIRKMIVETRGQAKQPGEKRFTILLNFPKSADLRLVREEVRNAFPYLEANDLARDLRVFDGVGFLGIDGASTASDEEILGKLQSFVAEKLQSSQLSPDLWQPVIVRSPQETKEKLMSVAGAKYTYRELEDYTDLISRSLKTLPIVSKVTRSGVVNEAVYLLYSQERLASYGLQPSDLVNAMNARNIATGGGQLEAAGKNIPVNPTGEFKNESEIGNVLINGNPPAYMRDIVSVVRDYQTPASYLNYFIHRDENNQWERSRSITLAAQMRSGEQIGKFSEDVDKQLESVKKQLPEDLIYARTSDQPKQVEESVGLFMNSLMEAIVLVVIVALIGFWDWRSALLMGLAIPITLAMTFGFAHLFGIDLQQVSIASLIIALGLLVDVPVVTGDAIKRDLAAGHPNKIASWLGPTKMFVAMIFATLTNIVAYLPFLTLPGDTGKFIYSLPIVLTASLVAAQIVSLTFIPLLGYYILRPSIELPPEERRKKGFAKQYYRVGLWAIKHRWITLALSLVMLALGGLFAAQLKSAFFPKDLSYLSYVDVILPEDAPLSATNEAATKAEQVIARVVAEYAKEHPSEHGEGGLESLTTFVGGGGPRFWFSVVPELQQLNYAQILIQVKDKHDTQHLIEPLQNALSREIPGARINVRQLESGAAVGMPIQIRVSGNDDKTLRSIAAQIKDKLEKTRLVMNIRDDWGAENFTVNVKTDPDRANLAGITNDDVGTATRAALQGIPVSTLREDDQQIPVIARAKMSERARIGDLKNLYIYSSIGKQRVPLSQVAETDYEIKTERIMRRNRFRTITVSAMQIEGRQASEVISAVDSDLEQIKNSLPAGYTLEIGGEQEEQIKGFNNLVVVLVISLVAIFLALLVQFRNAFKPFIVFAAVPYGLIGSFFALLVMDLPFGFMAFLGVISLVGIIVSHVIVLFDFIEEMHAEGEPLIDALLNAGIMRLRPVLITVGATVIALFPLAMHGGPLWEGMCYVQIGGLSAATVVTLLLVPVLYSIFVLDLKIIKWDDPAAAQTVEHLEPVSFQEPDEEDETPEPAENSVSPETGIFPEELKEDQAAKEKPDDSEQMAKNVEPPVEAVEKKDQPDKKTE
jgi:multidrug efflux pump subunit AcrB